VPILISPHPNCSLEVDCENEGLIHTLLQATSIDGSILDEWLQLSVRRAHTGIIKFLIDAGGNPNRFHRVHSSAATAMLQNAEKGKAAVKLLIESRLEIAGDYQLLIAAIAEGLDSMVELLLSSGADIHGHAEGEVNALMKAAGLGNEALVKALRATGANPKAQTPVRLLNTRMNSALISAMIYGIKSLDGWYPTQVSNRPATYKRGSRCERW
jgi:ankyrin repeat protein